MWRNPKEKWRNNPAAQLRPTILTQVLKISQGLEKKTSFSESVFRQTDFHRTKRYPAQPKEELVCLRIYFFLFPVPINGRIMAFWQNNERNSRVARLYSRAHFTVRTLRYTVQCNQRLYEFIRLTAKYNRQAYREPEGIHISQVFRLNIQKHRATGRMRTRS